MLKYLALFTYILLAFTGCIEQQVVESDPNLGHLRGKVIFIPDTNPNYYLYNYVEVSGTSYWSRLDSSGKYNILNLPEGEYTVGTRFRSNNGPVFISQKASVVAGKTTDVKDIIVNYTNGQIGGQFLSWVSIKGLNRNYYLTNNDTVLIDNKLYGPDSIIVKGLLRNYYFSDTSLTIEKAGVIKYVETQKGIFSLKLKIGEGINTVRIWEGHSETPPTDLFISHFYYVDITPTKIDIHWSTEIDRDAGDFDIHLIQKQINDSCWYQNKNPDWGIKNVSSDNPYLGDYMNEQGYNTGNESITFEHTPNGDYVLKVVYYDNASEPTRTIKPTIDLRFEKNSYTYSAPAEMSVGQVWTVLEFNAPDRTVNLINTISSGGTLAKREAKY
jgi:hypothetical protein